ncbi:MAG: radical SAM family heme chaperone HemW [Desulfobacterales bacterium]|nr:MAG: radical SAM family heme chaperone HemW [Desulfobacterales bacterium]
MKLDSERVAPAGLYVHIPFCRRKCPYCDFYSISDVSLIPAFLQALQREMQMLRPVPLAFDTLYLGGGTPSVLGADNIGQIMEGVRRCFTIRPAAEITVEVNPGTAGFEQLKAYRAHGVNRLSIGVQSFQEAHLNFLGRIHSGRDGRRVFEGARRAGCDNIGIDLIYGLPGQSIPSWRLDLQQAVDLQPEHLSCYMLTFESGTPMGKDLRRGRVRRPDEARVRELFDTTVDFLDSHGYVQYEISNFARAAAPNGVPQFSRHNQKYWHFAPYLGLGPAAHSFIEPQRSWNHRRVQTYIRDLEAGRLPRAAQEVLTAEQLMIEAIYLGLRTIDGIDLAGFQQRFGFSFVQAFQEVIVDLAGRGLIQTARQRCALTRAGLAYLDSITAMFTSYELSSAVPLGR